MIPIKVTNELMDKQSGMFDGMKDLDLDEEYIRVNKDKGVVEVNLAYWKGYWQGVKQRREEKK